DVLDTLTNPTLIIEVLSDTTESYDRGMKFKYYRMIPSLAEYVLVAQSECNVEQHVKQPAGQWLISESRSITDQIVLASIGCTLSLEEVYDKVKLP
ncbi:MAG TPA: Uma2 family endonuclease, partial [Blastocatellia bacterium]